MKCNWYCRRFPTCNLVFTKHQHFANGSKVFPQSSELQLYTLNEEPYRTHSQGWAEERKWYVFGIRKALGYQRFGHWVISLIPADQPGCAVASLNSCLRRRGEKEQEVGKMLTEGLSKGKALQSSGCRSDNPSHKTKGRGKEKAVCKSHAEIFSPRSGNSLIHLVVNLEWVICRRNGEGQVHTLLSFGPETVWLLWHFGKEKASKYHLWSFGDNWFQG